MIFILPLLVGGYAAYKAYKHGYKDPADQQKNAATDAIEKSRALGAKMTNYYEDAGKRRQGYYDKADTFADNNHGANYLEGPLQQGGRRLRSSPEQRQARGQQELRRHPPHEDRERLRRRRSLLQRRTLTLKKYGASMDAYGNQRTDTYDRYHQELGRRAPSTRRPAIGPG